MSTVRTQAGRTLLANEGVLPLFIGAMAEDDHVLLDYVLAIEDEMRAATLGEVDDAIVDAPCHHAADFGAGPEVDPGPCLIDRDELLDATHAADKKSS